MLSEVRFLERGFWGAAWDIHTGSLLSAIMVTSLRLHGDSFIAWPRRSQAFTYTSMSTVFSVGSLVLSFNVPDF